MIDYRGSPYSPSVADFPAVMQEVIELLRKTGADFVVLADVYEKVYDERQTKMLREVAELIDLFEREGVWTPSMLGTEDPKLLSARHDLVLMIAHDLLMTDPIRAYLNLVDAVKRERTRAGEEETEFMKTLLFILVNFEKTSLIRRTKLILRKLGKIPAGRTIYHTLFEVQIKPSFVSSRVFFHTPANIELVDQYKILDSTVNIYKHPEKIEFLYYVNPPEYNLSPEKYFILSKTREIVASYRPEGMHFMSPSEIKRYFSRVYETTISDLAKENNIPLTSKEREELAGIVTRYTVGYGMMELLLADRKLTDVYIDAPLGTKPVYVIHSEYGSCQTNVVFTEEEAKGIISRFRSLSGRPFDEAHPVLDLNLQDLQTRVAVIGPPLSPDGVAFALRLHKTTPWTLPQFIDVKMLNSTAAGLLSFFVDAQASTLVTGARGSGKTSFLTALMLEVLPSLRIIVQEDTLEIPVPAIKRYGYNIQRLKTRSPIGVARTTAEVAPEEALRTALRLGDSVLIIGEVRSKEAQVLYEAMRIGAIGNVVMGSIHGESAYSVWDRIVNDLGVPNTSFKATDVIVTCAPVRFKGAIKRKRRIVGITEVGKHWYEDPEKERGLIKIMDFNAKKDEQYIMENNLKRSELFPKLARRRGVSVQELWKDIRARAETKQYLVDMKNRNNIPNLLEARYTIPANDKWLLVLESQREEFGSVSYTSAKKEWQNWVLENQIKELIARRKRFEQLKKAKIKEKRKAKK